MTMTTWQLSKAINGICFDCDGTLTAIEGINELARYVNAQEKVEALTTIAMSETGINPHIYEERLKLVVPSQDHLMTLAHEYFENRAPDLIDVITIFQRLQKKIFIISAGLNPAVKIFGEKLSIPTENIFAVDLIFDKKGQYQHYDHQSPLIHNDGKRLIIKQLKQHYPELIHIGDGLNDVATSDIVRRFIGYGGFYYREHIAALCKYYIRAKSIAALLPLSLTHDEYISLTVDEQGVYQKGLMAIKEGMVKHE